MLTSANWRTKLAVISSVMLLITAAHGANSPKGVDLEVNLYSCNDPREGVYSVLAAIARDKAAAYFADMGFVVKKSDVARKVEVFCTRESAKKVLAAEFHASTDIPVTFSGTVQNATLFVVSKEIDKQNFTQLFGAERWADEEYEKLMNHEMIHSAHAIVATQLFGTEDGMGPQWLFEGMALEASGQLPTSEDELSKITGDDFDDFLRKAATGGLKAPVYVQYAKYYRYVRRFVSSKWIVENAGRPDVIDRIHQAMRASLTH